MTNPRLILQKLPFEYIQNSILSNTNKKDLS